MKTKILYILVSNETDYYLEMLAISAFSAKQRMPECHVALLVDDKTNETLNGKRAELLRGLIDEKVVIDFDPNLNAKRRSRYLKTSMRNHVEGDFIYIDTDTVIMQPLNDLDNMKEELCAVADGHSTVKDHHYNRIIVRESGYLNYDITKMQYYFNGGVIFAKDTKKNREFFARWHEMYKENIEKIDQDQPSFNKLQQQTNQIKELPGEYNVQLIVGMHLLSKAKILHFFGVSNYPLLEISSREFLKAIKEKGLTAEMKEKIQNPYSTFLPTSTIVRLDDFYFFYSRYYYSGLKRTLISPITKVEHFFASINKWIIIAEYKLLRLIDYITNMKIFH